MTDMVEAVIVPGNSDIPGTVTLTPGQTVVTLGQTGVTPGQTGGTPGQTVVTPGQTGVPTTIPGQVTATPSPVATATIIGAELVVLSLVPPIATGVPATNQTLRKRQSDLSASGFGYLASGGNTSLCALANQYMVGNGELMDAATGVLVSANTDLQPVPLNNPLGGSITTDFEVVNGILVWSNSAFYNGAAVFCLLNDVLYATFTAAGPPAGCLTVNVVVVQGLSFPPLREDVRRY